MVCKLSHLLTVALHYYRREQNERKRILEMNILRDLLKLGIRAKHKTMEVSPRRGSYYVLHWPNRIGETGFRILKSMIQIHNEI